VRRAFVIYKKKQFCSFGMVFTKLITIKFKQKFRIGTES